MIRFGGLRFGSQIEELGSVESDSIGSTLYAGPHFIWKLDVRHQLNARAVLGLRRQLAQRLALLRKAAILLRLALITLQRLLIGLNDDATVVAVDDHKIAAGNIGCMTQIGGATGLPIVHTAELLDWATGGPRPSALGA